MANILLESGRYMSKQQSKDAVLKCLSELQEPVNLKMIADQLGHIYPERSLRRWLTELNNEGLINKTGIKKGTRYQFIIGDLQNNILSVGKNKTSGNKTSGFHAYLSPEAIQAIEFVKQPIFTRPPVAYNDDWIAAYQPNSTFYLSEDIREELVVLGQSKSMRERAGTYARQIFNRLLIDLSYNSSRLEGNTYSLVDTEKLIMQGIAQDDKLDEERVMILNHKEAIRYLIENEQASEINQTNICTLHYLLADGLVAPQYAGHVRDQGVRIGSSTYQPFENPEQLINRLEIICNKASGIVDPFEQSLFLLIHIAYLQAFIDVNKRVSRLSANIPLIKNNLVPLSFNDVDKTYYANAMIAIYELNDVHAMIDIFCYSYRRSCEQYKIAHKVLGFDEIRVRYRTQRRAIVRGIVTQLLIGDVMDEYIVKQLEKEITDNDRDAFMKTVYEDLDALSPIHIRGMGIPIQQLDVWKKLNS